MHCYRNWRSGLKVSNIYVSICSRVVPSSSNLLVYCQCGRRSERHSRHTADTSTRLRCAKTREMASNVIFTHHILVCVFNKKEDPLVGLRKMVMPLRASNLHRSDLKKIVFLGDKDYMKLEWEEICNFHEVYILPGSPFCRADLRAVNANLADMVVFLSGTAVDQAGDPRLADKQSILASLNLK
ncbi:predicted protein, partial [Nematostella vectensis]